MKQLLFRNNQGISPVVSTMLVIAISISVIAATLLWGLPFIESSKRESQIENSKNDFLSIEGAIANLLENPRSSTYAYSFSQIGNSLEEGSVEMDSKGTRVVQWYTRNSSLLNFSVNGLDDADDEFSIDVDQGSIGNISLNWINDTCFSGDTEVLMSDGTSKRIDNINIGDSVKTYYGGSLVNQSVRMVHHYKEDQMQDFYVEINTSTDPDDAIKVTPNHLFYTTNRGWVKAEDIRVDDTLDCNIKNKNVEYVNTISSTFESYDLSVNNSNNYLVKVGTAATNDNYCMVSSFSIDNVPADNIEKITSYIEPSILDITSFGAIKTYTVNTGTSGRNFEGTMQIDLFIDDIFDYDNDGKIDPVGKIFLFDLGNIAHILPYSDGKFKTIYENGAIISYNGKEDQSKFVKEPNFYYNEEQNIAGFRILQMRPESTLAGTAGPGSGIYSIRSTLKVNKISGDEINSNYIRTYETENISNFSMQFFGDNKNVWMDFFQDSFDFQKVGSNLRFPVNDIKLIISSAVVKNRISYKK